jgi:hypothetical protein
MSAASATCSNASSMRDATRSSACRSPAAAIRTRVIVHLFPNLVFLTPRWQASTTSQCNQHGASDRARPGGEPPAEAGSAGRERAAVRRDLIFEPRGGPIDDEWLERADELDVYAVTMNVASLNNVLVTKLLALSEQNLDYSSVLEMARAIRDQLDWDEVRRRCEGSPYAKAFLVLVEELDVAPATSTR